ncbi:GH24971 [Drosophila grimshawi]|uniref:GH24971 n=1 Tax=Drosophila grimshawi TaxID=7222 RepID=B4K3W8_DROGR|nr:GH24971 [Drosophila grimshawi]
MKKGHLGDAVITDAHLNAKKEHEAMKALDALKTLESPKSHKASKAQKGDKTAPADGMIKRFRPIMMIRQLLPRRMIVTSIKSRPTSCCPTRFGLTRKISTSTKKRR